MTMTTTSMAAVLSLPSLMIAIMALVAAAHPSDAYYDSDSSGFTLAWGLAVPFVPTLVLAAATVLTLELLAHPWIARGLSVALMISMWTALLSTERQLMALLSAVVYHGVRELFVEWRRGFPSILQPKTRAHRVTLWWLFWVRVFAWGATFGAVGNSTSVATFILDISSDSLAPLVMMSLRFVVFCECVEVFVLLYLADQQVGYVWRRRVLLWCLSFAIGVAHGSGVLAAVIAMRTPSVTPSICVLLLVMLMWLTIQLPVDRLRALVSSRLKRPTSASRGRRRSSMLYRSGSDVEVVMMQPPVGTVSPLNGFVTPPRKVGTQSYA
ncbi:hypothetical protein PINS_up005652 [Pythium insidiosum]|nr:hypothetical protein PINS_up005652 [Pythium insidiosum]